MTSLRTEISTLSESIAKDVRRHADSSDATQEELIVASDAVARLLSEVREIQRRSRHSEELVSGITRDILSLDYAKKHVQTCIKALRNLHMWVNSCATLLRQITAQDYVSAAGLLRAVNELKSAFRPHLHVEKIKELKTQTDALEKELLVLSLQTLHSALIQPSAVALASEPASPSHFVGLEKESPEKIRGACMVLDEVAPVHKTRFLRAFLSRLFEPYERTFGPGGESFSLETSSRRLTYARRELKDWVTKYSEAIPASWRLEGLFAAEFCYRTRSHMRTLLKKTCSGCTPQALAKRGFYSAPEPAYEYIAPTITPATHTTSSTSASSSASNSIILRGSPYGHPTASPSAANANNAAAAKNSSNAQPTSTSTASPVAFPSILTPSTIINSQAQLAAIFDKCLSNEPGYAEFMAGTGKSQVDTTLPTEAVARSFALAYVKTQEFEKEMTKALTNCPKPKQVGPPKPASPAPKGGKLAPTPESDDVDLISFIPDSAIGLISSSFSPYLHTLVYLERYEFNEIITRLAETENWDCSTGAVFAGVGPGPDAMKKTRHSGSDEIFLHMKKSIASATKTLPPALYPLFASEFFRGLRSYGSLLAAHAKRLSMIGYSKNSVDARAIAAQSAAAAAANSHSMISPRYALGLGMGGQEPTGNGNPTSTHTSQPVDPSARIPNFQIISAFCRLVNTAEYAAETVPGFAEALSERISIPIFSNEEDEEAAQEEAESEAGLEGLSDLSDMISPSEGTSEARKPQPISEKDFCLTTSHTFALSLSSEIQMFNITASKTSASLAECIASVALTVMEEEMGAVPWGTLSTVGDQSQYVSSLNAVLSDKISWTTPLIATKFHSFLCSQTVVALCNGLTRIVRSIKKITPTGAHQLSLDASMIKTLLSELPQLHRDISGNIYKKHPIGSAATRPSATTRMYTKLVAKEMTPLESLLKVLACTGPALVHAFRTLLPTSNVDDLKKILDQLGTSRNERNDCLKEYETLSNPASAAHILAEDAHKIGRVNAATSTSAGLAPQKSSKDGSSNLISSLVTGITHYSYLGALTGSDKNADKNTPIPPQTNEAEATISLDNFMD